ncbi:MAG: tRNA (adenosine(37)-N6)-threonylcarbamoyltransferase complex transferase subunit TsaD [Elusimicrobiota bacterium]|jgi:N6-L-threonylcarbamoyladenine synthase|nr:tRNA (adenosine(37)-N6)-threonylcarbamoyltransferase complex transferase subunit TsaD [Elusimicrobiota bacterium]
MFSENSNILSIETSCDETSVGISCGLDIKSLIISSQIALHAQYFGVVPELASRAHIENINFVIKQSLDKANISFDSFAKEIDAIAFTVGPGLAGALLVGAMSAKTLALVYKKPLIPIHHLEGHLYSSFIENGIVTPPFLGVIISGGHTELIIVEDFGKYKILGATRDDAAGEAFDKAAKMLGLSYPGGPAIDKRAQKGNPNAIFFTRPYLKDSWDFSFSGIKTALLNYLSKNPLKGENHLNDICASFRQSIAETISFKAFEAAKKYNLKKIALGGGVCANSLIRIMFEDLAKKNKIKLYMPSLLYCGDNAAMIGIAAYLKHKNYGLKFGEMQLKPSPSLVLESW